MRNLVLNFKVIALVSMFAVVGTVEMACAMSASEAKKQGLITEDCRGYVQAVKPEGKAVADQINDQRRQEYARIAGQRNVPVAVVEAEAGNKLCGK